MTPEWETNCVYFATLLRDRFPDLWQSLERALNANQVQCRLLDGANDLWLRDFLPIQVDEDRFIQFRYEPSYLLGHEHLITGPEIARSIPYLGPCQTSDINLDGGNVVCSRQRVILTEQVFQENSNWNRQDLSRELHRLFQVDECIFIPRQPFDPFGHSDGVLRFVNEDTVLVNDYSKTEPDYGKRLKAVLKRHRLHIEELPYFSEPTAKDGIPSAKGCWINFLQTERLIVVLVFEHQNDDVVLKKLERIFAGMKVVPLRCHELAQEGGLLRCVSWSVRITNPAAYDPPAVRAVPED